MDGGVLYSCGRREGGSYKPNEPPGSASNFVDCQVVQD